MERCRNNGVNLGLLTDRCYCYKRQVFVSHWYYIAQYFPNAVLNERNIVSGVTLSLKILL
ncbi:MAG: hypothetical protein ACTMUB_09790 [cyanobacterium endosymbiont of Rhopalodia musculus]|uniref:hypothetical protein n=1 Tax=cyanobacterium endosymbiont of Epithemia clementina EcSB TaxID=3034674 RepID=UPI002481772C|nr:hypothetical protein [cyanobacterium endosymbiont of Epithemia clementina EcSB]WGT68332.1 hypothetical protein P3F56_04575 [cyanobacterium endosymbiont of Epithemia clementina EcSB]